MSFTPWKFFRNPPPTVPSPAVVQEDSSSQGTAGSQTPAATSRATSLIDSLGNLAGTANYLQSVILSLTKSIGISVDEQTDPDLARSLSSIYGTVPPAISIQMYSNYLDVEFGGQQVQVSAGSDSTIQPNPFQQQTITTLNKAVESSLSKQADFKSQSALMLRSLKTQSIVYTQWQSLLTQYPAASGQKASTVSNDVVQASSVDVGDDVYSVMQSHILQMANTYASVFNLLASVSSISQDIVCMVNTFATLGKAELAQIKTLFDLLRKTDVSESIQDIANSLTSFVFVEMMSEAAAVMFSLDRLAQMAISPLRVMSNSLGMGVLAVQGNAGGQLVGVIRSVTQEARIATGPLAGLIATNTAAASCGAPPSTVNLPPPSPSCFSSPGGSDLSLGMNDLSTLLEWGLAKANEKVFDKLSAFQKLTSRMQGDLCNHVKLLAIVNNLGTLSSLAGSFLTQQQGRNGVVSNTTDLLSVIGIILSNTDTGNGTTYTVQNGVVSVNPPSIPSPTPAATAVLSQAGVQTTLAGINQAV